MSTDPKDKMTLLLGNTLIKQIKTKAIEDGTAISKICRVILDAWQSNLFDYREYKNKGRMPEVPAVYGVAHNNKIIYIGQTTNIKQRFASHHHRSDFDKLQNELIIFWFTIDPEFLRDTEKVCIDLSEPELNGVGVEGAPTQIRVYSEEAELIEAHRRLMTIETGGKRITTADAVKRLINPSRESEATRKAGREERG